MLDNKTYLFTYGNITRGPFEPLADELDPIRSPCAVHFSIQMPLPVNRDSARMLKTKEERSRAQQALKRYCLKVANLKAGWGSTRNRRKGRLLLQLLLLLYCPPVKVINSVCIVSVEAAAFRRLRVEPNVGVGGTPSENFLTLSRIKLPRLSLEI